MVKVNEIPNIELNNMNDTSVLEGFCSGYEILFVTQYGKMIGCITTGDIMKALKEKADYVQYINKDNKKIIYENEQQVQEEADRIFKEYSVIHNIPVVDEQGKILFQYKRDTENNNEEILNRFLMLSYEEVNDLLMGYHVDKYILTGSDFMEEDVLISIQSALDTKNLGWGKPFEYYDCFKLPSLKENEVLLCWNRFIKEYLINTSFGDANLLIYTVDELLENSKAASAAIQKLEKQKKQKKTSSIIRVVFIVQCIHSWSKVEQLYDELRSRNNIETYIVCVPSAIKEGKLLDETDVSNDIYEYFVQQGYSAINALAGQNEWFDLQKLNPDYVFHARPYNGYMPEVYQSDAICEYAKICHILYAVSLEGEKSNNFHTNFNREYFKNVSMYFASSEYEKECWNVRFAKGYQMNLQKAYYLGLPIFDYMIKNKTDSSGEGTVFIWTPRWNTEPKVGGSNFFRYKDFFLEYAEYAGENSFIIRPHPMMFDNFIATGELTKKEAVEYRKRIEQLPNVRLDELSEYTETFWKSSVLISDYSSIMWEYFVTGKPLVYCTNLVEKRDWTQATASMLSACYIVHNKQELKETMDMLGNHIDPLFEKRQELVREVLKKNKDAAKRIADVLIANL